jgi:hypothetical protein
MEDTVNLPVLEIAFDVRSSPSQRGMNRHLQGDAVACSLLHEEEEEAMSHAELLCHVATILP